MSNRQQVKPYLVARILLILLVAWSAGAQVGPLTVTIPTPISIQNIRTNGTYSAFVVNHGGTTNLSLFCYDRFGHTSDVKLYGTGITPLRFAHGEIAFAPNGNLCFLGTGNGVKTARLWEWSLDNPGGLPLNATLVTTFDLGMTNADSPFMVTMKSGAVVGGFSEHTAGNLVYPIYRFTNGTWTNYGGVDFHSIASGLPSTFLWACEQPIDNSLFTFQTQDGGTSINVTRFWATNGLSVVDFGICAMYHLTNGVSVDPRNEPYGEICTVAPVSDWNSNRIVIAFNNINSTVTGFNFDRATQVTVTEVRTNNAPMSALVTNYFYGHTVLWYTTNLTNQIVRENSSVLPSLYPVNGASGSDLVSLRWLSYNTNNQTGIGTSWPIMKQSKAGGVEQTPALVDYAGALLNVNQSFPYNGDFTYEDTNSVWHLIIDPPDVPYRYPRDNWPYWVAGLNGYTSPVYSTTLYLTNFGSVSDGTTDNSAAWTNAYNTAADLTTIVMPPGITKITNFMALKPGKRVRVVGTGSKGGSYAVGKSMLLLSAGNPNGSSSDGAPIIVGGDATRNKILVTGNFNRGSTTLAVNSIAGVTNGQHARFFETNDNKAYILANYPYQFWDGTNNACDTSHQTNKFGVFESQSSVCSNSFAHQGQSFTVTSALGNAINISSPLYWPYIALSNVPTLEVFTATATGIGLENLVINYTGAADYVSFIAYANQCWVTDCCISNANHATIQLLDANNCLVRGNQTWRHQVMDSNAREGIALSQYCSDNLVENNSVELANIGIKSQEMNSGNVFAYNFSHMGWVTNSGNPTIDGSVFCPVYGMHGDNAIYELWEGNVAPQFSADTFWGGDRAGTQLRNWWTRDGYSGLTGAIRFNQGGEAADIDTTNWYFTAIGNVLGSGRDVGDANVSHTVANFGFARSKLPTPNVPPASPADTNVSATLFWHGNYNMVSQSASWSNGVAQVVPNSFYLTSAPFWFAPFNWPPIGPDIAASIAPGINLSNTILIPAQASEMFSNNLIFPDPQITKQPLSTNVFTSQTALFTVTAQGNSTLTYQWKTNGVAAGTNGPALAVGPAVNVWSGMTATCTVTNLGGSVTSSTATLTVTPDPVILTQPQNATVGVGSTATFTVVVTNQNAVTYQWSKNGSTVGGATSSAYTTPATIAADNNSHFFVVATDSFGSVQSANATLTVTNIVSPPDPVITSQPQSTNIFTSQSALFQLTATGGSTLAYAWKTNGVAAGTNGPALSLGPCPTIWSGMAVLCVVSDLAGSVTSSIATLTVSPDPVITSQPANATAVSGATASFVVSATGQSALTFQWYRNGVFVAGANSSGYTTPPLTSSNNGDTYNSVVTDTAGSLASANATLTVTSPPPTNNVGKITNAHIGKAHIGP